jgi:hypothetical protein
MKPSPSLSLALLSLVVLTWRVQAAFWMENIPRQGQIVFGNVPGYNYYRSVKDFGAMGLYLPLAGGHTF